MCVFTIPIPRKIQPCNLAACVFAIYFWAFVGYRFFKTNEIEFVLAFVLALQVCECLSWHIDIEFDGTWKDINELFSSTIFFGEFGALWNKIFVK